MQRRRVTSLVCFQDNISVSEDSFNLIPSREIIELKLQMFSHTLLKTKIPKENFHSNATEEQFYDFNTKNDSLISSKKTQKNLHVKNILKI